MADKQLSDFTFGELVEAFWTEMLTELARSIFQRPWDTVSPKAVLHRAMEAAILWQRKQDKKAKEPRGKG